MPFFGEAVQLRAAKPREALTGRASYQDVRAASGNEPLEIELIFEVALIARKNNGRGMRAESADVLRIGACRSLVDIDGGEDVATRGLKAQAETSGTAEQVHNAEAPWPRVVTSEQWHATASAARGS